MGKFQACGFLVSSHGRAVPNERELQENVYSNDDYVDTASLLEQVPFNFLYHPCYCPSLRSANTVSSYLNLLYPVNPLK